MKPKLGVVLQGVCGAFLVATMGLLYWEVRGLDDRIARLESDAGAARTGKARSGDRARTEANAPDERRAGATPAVLPADPGGSDDEVLRENLRRLTESVRGLESRLGEVTEKSAALERETANLAARAAAVPALPGVVDAQGQLAQSAEAQALNVEMQAASTLAWLEAEMEKLADEVDLSPSQRDRAKALLAELTDKYFPKDGKSEEMWQDWQKFQTEYDDRVKGMMTSEQQNEYASYRKKQLQEQVSTSTSYTVATMAKAVGLNDSQRDRIKSKIKDYYGKMYGTDYDQSGSTGGMSAYDPNELRDMLHSEIRADQVPKFDEWYKTYMGGGGQGVTESQGE